MCMAYFLGTSVDTPLIAFDETDARFNVGEPTPEEMVAQRHLATPHVRYVGSHTSCGCGFRCDAFGDPHARREDAADTQADHEALASYLGSLPAAAQPIRIFGCWSGDEADPPEHFRSCTAEEIRGPDFTFREKELITITP
jgi:hypothetical protein